MSEGGTKPQFSRVIGRCRPNRYDKKAEKDVKVHVCWKAVVTFNQIKEHKST